MKLDELSLDDLVRGYTAANGTYICHVCGAAYSDGEVYNIGGRFYEAVRAARVHMETAHADYLGLLLEDDTKYNTLTDNQKQLLHLFAAGTPDKEVAKALGVSASTVRHQKFMFREKAKQARLYLAMYELVFAGGHTEGGGIMPIHDNAKMVDQRYVVTEAERAHILQTSFTSLEPLRLGTFSPKEKKKVVILTRIAEEFEAGREYTEPEVNAVLSGIFADFATLRRYLIQYGFMERTRDCAKYWLK